jgi:hypothetical protein
LIPNNELSSNPFSIPASTIVSVQVQAINSIGAGPFSAPTTTGATLSSPPAAVTGLTKTSSGTAAYASLSWNALTTTN